MDRDGVDVGKRNVASICMFDAKKEYLDHYSPNYNHMHNFMYQTYTISTKKVFKIMGRRGRFSFRTNLINGLEWIWLMKDLVDFNN